MSSRKRSRAEDDSFSVSVVPPQEPPLVRKAVEKTFMPKMNMYELTDKQTGLTKVTVMIGLPGLQPGNVTINLLHDKLTISGQSIEPPLGEENYIIRELQRGKFSRVLTVPLGMRLEDFKAGMENGLLMVTFPKDPPEQIPHRIPIESAHVLVVSDD